MRVGWLNDDAGYLGGAELTQREFRAAAPPGVEIIDCPPGGIVAGLDRYVVNNVVQYRATAEIEPLRNAIWFHHDLSPWIDPDVRQLLNGRCSHIFCSPIQRDRYGIEGKCIPPFLDRSVYGPGEHREGACSVATWRSPGKGGLALIEWAAANGPVDVYGPRDFAPLGPRLNYLGELEPGRVAETLSRYETFVFLPRALEPFCRCVAEAWASGCKLVVNRNIGATWWIENDPEAMDSAREDFWEAVCG